MQSLWGSSPDIITRQRPALTGNIKTEALVIGGGMAGILTAHRLREAGINCVVIEARTIGSGTTGKTTAKITAQHGLIYADLIRRLGPDPARQYYDANTRAITDFKNLSERYPCNFEEKTAWVYSTDNRSMLEKEAKAYRKLGIAERFQEAPSLPVRTVGALGMERQAQFHPLMLLNGLSSGMNIFENTFVRKVENNTAITDNGNITAENIILATHYPMVNIPGLYFLKLHQHRSYVLALKGAQDIGDMYLDEQEKGHSFRMSGEFLLIGGGDHKTGKKGGAYGELRGLVGKAYPAAREEYHWAAQDCMSLDMIPYIGRHRAGASNLFVATGFNKWGMTGSMVASKLICDLICTGESELEALYSPRRAMLPKQIFVNIGAAAAGLLSIGGPRCAHMGCKLHWNKNEKTWDCTCHGSRFSEDGKLIDNPAKKSISI